MLYFRKLYKIHLIKIYLTTIVFLFISLFIKSKDYILFMFIIHNVICNIIFLSKLYYLYLEHYEIYVNNYIPDVFKSIYGGCSLEKARERALNFNIIKKFMFIVLIIVYFASPILITKYCLIPYAFIILIGCAFVIFSIVTMLSILNTFDELKIDHVRKPKKKIKS